MTEWIQHNGGKCPLEKGTEIDIRDADGEEWFGVPALNSLNDESMWEHRSPFLCNNIDAYRVVSK